MPIVIAAAQAMLEARFNLYGVQATTHPCGPLPVINGPIRKELGINCAFNIFGPGTLVNAVIGTAIRLVLLNIGGATAGEVDKANHGHPDKFTYVIGENEEKSPWQSLSTEKGLSSEQNSVTVIGVEGPHNGHDHCSSSSTGILTTIAGTLECQGNNNIIFQKGESIMVLGLEDAETIAKAGFTKKDVKEFLFQKAGLPRKKPSLCNIKS